MSLEHVCMSDDSSDWSLPLTPDSFHDRDSPFPHTDESPRRSRYPNLRLRGFEKPSFVHIAILAVLCLISYPILHVLPLVARNKPLFTVRLMVAVWCSAVGFALNYALRKIGDQHIEAASE